jgi:holo-[acyl-carrier protein] synthase
MIVGTGVDIVEIERLRTAIDRLKDRFVDRIFTPDERQYCSGRREAAQHYAARFAAKEALFKALGTGWANGVSWLDAEVRKEQQGPPSLALHGEAKRLSANLGVRTIHLSLTHSGNYAVAMVILEG